MRREFPLCRLPQIQGLIYKYVAIPCQSRKHAPSFGNDRKKFYAHASVNM